MNPKTELLSPEVLTRGLEARAAGAELADYIDDVVIPFAVQQIGLGATPKNLLCPAILALGIAKTSGTVADLLYILASIAPDDDVESVDAMLKVYEAGISEEFIAAEALGALGLLAERNATARAELPRLIQRLTLESPRYLLIRAAKIVGRQVCLGSSLSLERKLDEWSIADDVAVESEARYQTALISLHNALQEPNRDGFQEKLQESRFAFARAEASEELRSDATGFVMLADLLLTAFDAKNTEGLARVQELAANLTNVISNPHWHPWRGLNSAAEQVIEYRLNRIAVGVCQIAARLSQSESWIRLGEAVTELAAIFSVIWHASSTSLLPDSGVALSLRAIVHVGLAPTFGPFIEQAVTRVRLNNIIQFYESEHGQNETYDTLNLLLGHYNKEENALAGATESFALDRARLVRFAQTEPSIAAYLADHSPEFKQMLIDTGYEVLSSEQPLPILALAVDEPNCIGNNPHVDETARELLASAAARLGPSYSGVKWTRFKGVVIEIIKAFEFLRQAPEPFTLCKQDNGKGITANEVDLQEYVFQHLYRQYGTAAEWERAKVSGGRTDAGVFNDDCRIPIEVKAEYKNVSRDYVRDNFLSQPDDYATAFDRVACLLILDVRDSNADRHQKRRSQLRKSKPEVTDQPHKLYSLRESFWVDCLPADPQLPSSMENVVVVGLAPANRTRPSSTTSYSRRPSVS